MPYVVTEKCILCGACVVGCESDAISEGDTRAYIDPELCIECGICEMNCPSDAVIFMDKEEAARIVAEVRGTPSS